MTFFVTKMVFSMLLIMSEYDLGAIWALLFNYYLL